MTAVPATMRQIRSLVTEDGRLELRVAESPTPTPGPDQVLVRVDAAPINPSDLGMLFAGADMGAVELRNDATGSFAETNLTPAVLRAMAARVGKAMSAGNEGAGTVVAAGSSPAAQALMGKVVAGFGGGFYAQYRLLSITDALVMPDGVTARQGASCFVNPLTALGMTETMRLENHTALVHTAAASNLGQMLNRICLADGIPLVNIVRKAEQVELLRSQGAKHVVNSSDDDFMPKLVDALAETNATIAFDAIGGGKIASQILTGMEQAAGRNTTEFNRYGSNTFKQVYIYGGLDRGPTELTRSFGFSWSLGGWLLTPFLERVGAAETERLRQRVAREITTTFASGYTAEVDMDGMLEPKTIRTYGRTATGTKYLVLPNG